jgi:hypothetical protein
MYVADQKCQRCETHVFSLSENFNINLASLYKFQGLLDYAHGVFYLLRFVNRSLSQSNILFRKGGRVTSAIRL